MLSLSLIFGVTGCGDRDDDKEEEKEKILTYNGAVNTTIDPQSKWYNSSIYGAIDASLDVDIKDDFYTAVNKEWIVNHEAPTEDDEEDDFVSQTSEKSKERLINIISGMDDEEALNDVSIDIPREEPHRLPHRE